MKKLALISSYCNTKDKVDVLDKNIEILKKNGIDVLIISPFVLDKFIMEKSDYFFITKDNPVYEWPKRGWNFWTQKTFNNVNVQISKTVADYGWASLHQVKTLNDIAINLDYDYYYHLIYDLKITDEIQNYFNGEYDKLVFPSKRNETYWETGLHFMIFNKKNLSVFNSYITEESFNSIKTEESVFDWLKKIVDIMPIKISPIAVEDEIYLYENEDIYDYSPTNKIKFFIDKNDLTYGNIKLFFYHINDDVNVKIFLPKDNVEKDVTYFDIVDLNFNKFNLSPVSLIVNGEIFDITETIKQVKHNTLDFI